MNQDLIRAVWHLHNWGDWVKVGDDNGLGYKISNLYGTGGITCWDDFEQSVDAQSAQTSDMAISQLDLPMQNVLTHKYVAAVFIFKRHASDELLDEATLIFWVKAKKLGLV